MPQVANWRAEFHTDEAIENLGAKVSQWLQDIGADASSTAAGVAPHKTGTLRNSITYQTDSANNCVYVGTNIPYATYQELGTSRISGKHYLQFGATAHTREYQALLEQYLKQ